MKKLVVPALIVAGILTAGAYYLYQSHLPDLVARAIVTDSLPVYIPKQYQEKIEAIRRPINKQSEAIISEMHASGVPVQKVLSVIDNTSEEQAYAMLDEINRAAPENTNEVFNIVRKHLATDFDAEILREPFNEHVTMRQVEKVIHFANLNRKKHDVDFTTAKAILKKILLQKENEFQTKADE